MIEDDRDQCQLIRDQLESRLRVVTASDGLEGYRLACADRPSAIVLDVAMPSMDGWTVLRRLRSNPLTCTVPVIVVTGLERDAIEDHARLLGVHGIVQKPYGVDALYVVVDAAIRSSEV